MSVQLVDNSAQQVKCASIHHLTGLLFTLMVQPVSVSPPASQEHRAFVCPHCRAGKKPRILVKNGSLVLLKGCPGRRGGRGGNGASHLLPVSTPKMNYPIHSRRCWKWPLGQLSQWIPPNSLACLFVLRDGSRWKFIYVDVFQWSI